jgi:hypothetical protein
MELQNIDLEITFSEEPTALLSEIEELFVVLFSGWREDAYFIALEVNLVTYTEEEVLRSFLESVARLSEAAKRDLSKARKREFNLGYNLKPGEPTEVSIPHPLVRLIADSGYSLGVTFYRPDGPSR